MLQEVHYKGREDTNWAVATFKTDNQWGVGEGINHSVVEILCLEDTRHEVFIKASLRE